MATVANNDTFMAGYHTFANTNRLSPDHNKRSYSSKERASPVKLHRTFSSPANETFVQQRDRLAKAIYNGVPTPVKLSKSTPSMGQNKTPNGQRVASPRHSDKEFKRPGRVKRGSARNVVDSSVKNSKQENESPLEHIHTKSEASMKACLSQAAKQMKTYLTKKKENDDSMRRYGVQNGTQVDKSSSDTANDNKPFGLIRGKTLIENQNVNNSNDCKSSNVPLPSVEPMPSPSQRFVNNSPYSKAPKLPSYAVYQRGRSQFQQMIENSHNGKHDDRLNSARTSNPQKMSSHEMRALTARYALIQSLSRTNSQLQIDTTNPRENMLQSQPNARGNEVTRLLELNKEEFDELARQFEEEARQWNDHADNCDHVDHETSIYKMDSPPKTPSPLGKHIAEDQAHLRYSHQRRKSAKIRTDKLEASLDNTKRNPNESLYTTAAIKTVPSDCITESLAHPRSAILRQYGVGLQTNESTTNKQSHYYESKNTNTAIIKHKEGIKRAATALSRIHFRNVPPVDVLDLKPDTTKCQSERGEDTWSIVAEDDSDDCSIFSSYAGSLISNEGDGVHGNDDTNNSHWPSDARSHKERKRDNLLKVTGNKHGGVRYNSKHGPLGKLCISNSSNTLGKTFIYDPTDKMSHSSSKSNSKDGNLISVNYLNTYSPSGRHDECDPSGDSDKTSTDRRTKSGEHGNHTSTGETNSEMSCIRSAPLRKVTVRPGSGCCIEPLACGSSSFISINDKYDTKPNVTVKLRRALSMFEAGDYVAFQHEKFSKALDMENHRPLKYYGEREKTKFLKVKISHDKLEYDKTGVKCKFTDL